MLRRSFFIRNSEFLYKKRLERAEKSQEQVDKLSQMFKRQSKIISDHPTAINITAVFFIAAVLYYDYHYSFNGVLPVLNPITHLQYNLRSGAEALPTGVPSENFGQLPTLAEAVRSNIQRRVDEEKQVYFLKNHHVTGTDPLHKSEAEIALMGRDMKHPLTEDGRSADEIHQYNALRAGIDPQEKVSPLKMNVIAGHLDHRENFWTLRNNERNWSIMAQDRQRQQDCYLYRKERSKDDDYGRQSFT